MKNICISGVAHSGKDTTAGLIQKRLHGNGKRVLVTHYADLLKFMCSQLFGWDGQKDEHGRHILQYVGTDVIRKQLPDFWVDFIIRELRLFPDQWDYVIIPDCRFPNEFLATCMKRQPISLSELSVHARRHQDLLELMQAQLPGKFRIRKCQYAKRTTSRGAMRVRETMKLLSCLIFALIRFSDSSQIATRQLLLLVSR